MKKHWPLIASLAVLYAVVAVCLAISLSQNNGTLVYAVDDTYIHMAIAKNFSEDGVWGVTSHGFSSSSSSILWVLLLSLSYFLFGVNESAPFILNLVFATAAVSSLYLILRRYRYHPAFNFAVLLAFIFLTPLPALVFVGMEHILHTVVTILFFYLSVTVVAGGNDGERRGALFVERSLLVLGPLVVMSRYEAVFMVFTVCTLLLFRRRFSYALLLGTVSVLPAFIYGLVSFSQGWHFLPASVLLKGNMVDYSSVKGIAAFLGEALGRLRLMGDILTPVLLSSIFLLVKRRKQQGPGEEFKFMLLVFIPTALLHLHFAKVGNFFRYEAYIVSLAVLVSAVALGEYFSGGFRLRMEKKSVLKFLTAAFFIYLVSSPLVSRGWASLKMTPQATTNIYEQQYQMGLLLKNHFSGESVAANDIGAISFLGEIKLLDMRGIATFEVARLIREGSYSVRRLSDLLIKNNVAIVMIYDNWFRMPDDCIKVGEWELTSPRYSTGGDTVSFYAVGFEKRDRLISSLRQFSSRLPKGVEQRGMYTDRNPDIVDPEGY